MLLLLCCFVSRTGGKPVSLRRKKKKPKERESATQLDPTRPDSTASIHTGSIYHPHSQATRRSQRARDINDAADPCATCAAATLIGGAALQTTLTTPTPQHTDGLNQSQSNQIDSTAGMTSLPSSSPSVGSSPGVARGDSFSLNMASANTKTAPSPPQQQQTNAPTQPNGTHAHATAPAAAPAPSTLPLPPSLPVSVALSSPSPSVTPHLINKPSFLELPKFRFLIMDAPNDDNLPAYIEVCKKKQVVALARICDPCYSTAPLLAAGINVIEVPFADGDPPPPHGKKHNNNTHTNTRRD